MYINHKWFKIPEWTSYTTNKSRRINLIMGEAIEGRSVDERVKILERKVEQEKQKHRHEMGAIRAQLLSALDDGEE